MGVGTAASFKRLGDGVYSADGTMLYFTDSFAHKILQMRLSDKLVTTLAGSGKEGSADGKGEAASFSCPCGIVMGPNGMLLVVDSGNYKIRRVCTATAEVTTVAGSGEQQSEDGVGTAASFNGPDSLALSPDQKTLFVSDFDECKIRQVQLDGWAVTTLAGSGEEKSEDGTGAAASFDRPWGLALSLDGKLIIIIIIPLLVTAPPSRTRRCCRVIATCQVRQVNFFIFFFDF